MNRNTIIMRIALGVILVTAVACGIFIQVLKLEKPVFLKIYMDSYMNINKDNSVYDVEFSKIKYITNIDDKRRVNGIEFPDVPDFQFLATEDLQPVFSMFNTQNSNQTPGTNYGRSRSEPYM